MRTAPWLIAALGLVTLTAAGCVQESYRSAAYAPYPAYASNPGYAQNSGYQQQSRNNQYWNSARRDADRDGIPNRYDRDANGDGIPDRYQGRYN